MRIGALDISKRKIGIAFSDKDNSFISFSTIVLGNKMNMRAQICDIFTKYKPDITIIGLPISLYTECNNFLYVKEFTHSIRHLIGKYIFIDERMTTNLSERLVKDNPTKTLDEITACIFIEWGFVSINKLEDMLKNNNYII